MLKYFAVYKNDCICSVVFTILQMCASMKIALRGNRTPSSTLEGLRVATTLLVHKMGVPNNFVPGYLDRTGDILISANYYSQKLYH